MRMSARAPLLVLSGTPPRAQENRGALQDMVHTEFVRPLTRYARTVREPDLVLQELDEALSRAFGQGGEPGPVYLDFPVDTLRAEPSRAMQLSARVVRAASRRSNCTPTRAAVARAVELLWAAKRPLVITGRGARGAAAPAAAAARPPRRALPRHRREPRPGAGRPSVGRRGDARLGHGRGRRRRDRRPPARLPARLRLAGGVRRREVPAHRRLRRASCATTGAARWRCSPRRRPR